MAKLSGSLRDVACAREERRAIITSQACQESIVARANSKVDAIRRNAAVSHAIAHGDKSPMLPYLLTRLSDDRILWEHRAGNTISPCVFGGRLIAMLNIDVVLDQDASIGP